MSEWPKCPTCGKEHTFQGWADKCCAGKDLVQRNPAPDTSPVRAPTGTFIHTGPALATTTSIAPSPSPVVEVTEEMVEAAAKARHMAKFEPYVHDGHRAFTEETWDKFPDPNEIKLMRAALVAALRVR